MDNVDLSFLKERLKFRKSYGVYCCTCPFHSEITPSMFINTNRNFFHCYGCGKSGTIEDLIKELKIND